MEQINKLLILLTGLSIGAIIYIVVSSNELFSKTIVGMMDNKNVVVAPHAYNDCMKILIDQVNKENKQSDFDSMKSICFGLLDKETPIEK
ncbi:MAG: hypothetical protein NWS20_02320 [Rickettsiaceae bacterium]|nr:hypothetical protein [Rickettsiaceae bacterium]MDP4832350.1 hypothetical protein [Rickettsiaceae bacterium]MDP5020172.1 hypothetical protein [Rickettsiaceae bacterium]MDP5082932.1 hypothetical protein [Rickettsiaceae bacterium]